MQSNPVDEWIEQLAADADYWGTQMDLVARETIQTMQYSSQDYTLNDLHRAFDDSEYREQIDGLQSDEQTCIALAHRAETLIET